MPFPPFGWPHVSGLQVERGMSGIDRLGRKAIQRNVAPSRDSFINLEPVLPNHKWLLLTQPE